MSQVAMVLPFSLASQLAALSEENKIIETELGAVILMHTQYTHQVD